MTIRERLHTDETFRRQFLEEAMASMAFEGQDVTWDEAVESLERVLQESIVSLAP